MEKVKLDCVEIKVKASKDIEEKAFAEKMCQDPVDQLELEELLSRNEIDKD